MANNTENLDYQNEFGDKLMHHDYDGIKELDNPTPKWVMIVFAVTIAFSLYYFVHFFAMDGYSQDEEYIAQSKEHDEEYKNVEASTVKLELLSDETSIAEGENLYKSMNCGACHGANGEGNAIGPNLTDNAWLYGCDFTDIFNITKKGKGTMPGFKSQMDDEKIQKTVSYIIVKMKGSNPENAKAEEGKNCE